MTIETSLTIDPVVLQADLSAVVADFERQIEERLKPALRTALEGVLAEFTDGLGEAGAPVPADPVAFLDRLTAQHRRFEERMKLANERLEERLRGIAA